MTELINEARTSISLRDMSPLIRQHFETIERRMRKRQRMWGGNFTVVNEETKKQSHVIRRSLAFEKVMKEMPIEIEKHDLLVGSSVIDDTVVRCIMPHYILNEELGMSTVQMAHKCPDYDTLLERGLRDIINELKSRISEAENSKFEDQRRSKLEFIDSCIKEAESVIFMAQRYALLAEKMANDETLPSRQKELREIADVCRRVPEFPARSLHEAAQSVWFLNYAFFETHTTISIGRIDRILNPYLLKDLEAGNITLLRAQEIVDSFVLHCNDRAQIEPKNYILEDQRTMEGAPTQCGVGYYAGFATALENDQADAINHWGLNILLSGLQSDGGDATSALTYLFLNSHEKFSMTAPVLTVRMHKNTPPELLERASEVLKTGGGMPFINNDDVIVSAWEALGVSMEDACKYANSNCWETLIQGMSNQEMIRGLNFLYFLELALNNGEPFIYAEAEKNAKKPDRNNPISFSWSTTASYKTVYGAATGNANDLNSFDALMYAWKIQLDNVMQKGMEHINRELKRYGSHGKFSSNSLLSILTRGCVENLTCLTRRGAKYDMWHLMAEAVSNAADAAAAIKKFVFEEKIISLTSLVELLKNNWAGEEGKIIRQRFINDAPKFGNNNDYVDSIAQEMVDYFIERSAVHGKRFPDIIFSPCIGTYSWIITIGKKIGASADGRESQELIAANMSPVPGRDVSGPIAALHSYLKLNTRPMAAGAPIDLRLSKNGLEGQEGTKRIAALIKTFLEQGGNMMTLTVSSTEELKKAMEDPEKYRGLRVRMGGWSAYFVLLSKASQQLHLKRVEHGFS